MTEKDQTKIAHDTDVNADGLTAIATQDFLADQQTVVDNNHTLVQSDGLAEPTLFAPENLLTERAANAETIVTPIPIVPDAFALPQEGDVLNNKYQLEKKLGQGGMGCVFKALDLTQQKVHGKSNLHVAIKLLLPTLTSDEMLVLAFHREADRARKLTHKNIIKVFPSDIDGNRHYIPMEYLQGEPLDKIINAHGAIALNKAWPIIRDMGEGLAHAHDNDIVHCDFKPANVFILSEGDEVKILDFGIASELNKTEETLFNRDDLVAYTKAYASYETLCGAKKADPRDDIYAFGLVVYKLLTGQHPYQDKPATEVNLDKSRGSHQAPLPPPGLTKKQWQLLSQAIEIEEKNRPKNLRVWLAAFNPETENKAAQSKMAARVIGGLFALAVLAAGIYAWQTQTPSKEQTKQAQSPNEPAFSGQTSEAAAQTSNQPTATLPLPSPPSANAGTDKQAVVGDWVTLDGSTSKAAQGGQLSGYSWQLTARPNASTSILSDDHTATPRFLADKAGSYHARLTVTDDRGQTSVADEVIVNVLAPEPKLSFTASKSQYRIGEYFAATVQAADDGYLGIVYISSTGEKLQIFPNGYQQNSRVNGGKSYLVPPKEHRKMLQIQGPEGIDTLVAVFSQQPLPDDLDTHVQTDGSVTDLSPEVVVQPIHYQIIK